MFWWHPHNKLEKEVVTVYRKNEKTVEKDREVSPETVEDAPIMFRPYIRFKLFVKHLHLILTWLLLKGTLLGVNPIKSTHIEVVTSVSS